jgi:ATP-dependent helicase HrpA
VRLFRNPESARQSSLGGIQRLVERAVHKELGWLEKDLRGLTRFESLYAALGSGEALRHSALLHLKDHVLPRAVFPALIRAHFDAAVATARDRLRGLAPPFIDQVGVILNLRQTLALRCKPPAVPSKGRTLTGLDQLGAPPPPPKAATGGSQGYPGMAADLERLVPGRFLERVAHDQLRHVPRYLQAMGIRADRAALNGAKDQERERQVRPYLEALRKLEAGNNADPSVRERQETLRWMIEEFKVSLFAQELGTAMPVSAKRLDRLIAGE